MTDLSRYTSLDIDSRHVLLQFSRAGRPESGAFIHREIARRMLDRLKLIRIKPDAVLDAGCGTGTCTPLLRERFTEFLLISQDHHPGMIESLRKTYGLEGIKAWLDRVRHKDNHRTICADLAQTRIDAESIDLVWSNLALHWHPEPHRVIQEWGRILKPEGLAFFSCYGPATFKELRKAIADAGLQTATMPFVDMHDFGDLLIDFGFADPVMDQETLTLTYKDTDSLLRDVKALGGNASKNRHRSLVSRTWFEKLKAALEAQRNAQGLLQLTLEVSYGHAWRKAVRRIGSETKISLQAIGRKGNPRG